MQAKAWLRAQANRLLLHERHLALTDIPFAPAPHFQDVSDFGLYLHIPFCRQICPYCPYNKEIYRAAMAERYADAVVREIDQYASVVGRRPVSSFYIGGGTPTTMLQTGLPRILEHIYRTLNMQCRIHMESHPNDLTTENLAAIAALGVDYLSIGVEALQDHHLRTIGRPYTASEARAAIGRAVGKGFKCVNVDLMFALPDQTYAELRAEAQALVNLGVDQVATYPLFSFPYTRWPQLAQQHHYEGYSLWQKRRMLRVLEQIFDDAGYERTSVWAFTRKGVPKYCSVTVPIYLGLGASAASYLPDIFYVNTFDVSAYIQALSDGRMPVALSLDLTRRMQMAGWLYWRIYEMRFRKSDFARRFQEPFDGVYGGYFSLLKLCGMVTEHGDEIRLTDAGAYWLHVIQDMFSIDYVSTLWGTSRREPWPQAVTL
ncbi:MAG TPA: coproporphyrinogen-III oxidase family protein [Roseiflexaceae bacterium]|nr:coproporphyrinogen-III oxidase family protein [Roseiflexaceae bacterium]